MKVINLPKRHKMQHYCHLVSVASRYSIACMAKFESKYWNLSQAAAWVVYRKRDLVNQFEPESPERWNSINFYSKMETHQEHSTLDDLQDKLIHGKLVARGRENSLQENLTTIPSEEWHELWIRPPSIKRRNSRGYWVEQWIDLRFKSADMKKLWRGKNETEGRTKYDWDKIKKMYHDAKRNNPDFSDNQIIVEIQLHYAEKYGDNSAPARTTLQNKIKDWSTAS
jgi:hypothetical protein